MSSVNQGEAMRTYDELTLAMTLYQIFSFVYVFNYFQFEHGMIHAWDIVSERFGWNLVWGDYVLAPFFYCIAGWWLVHPVGPPLSPLAAAGIVLLFVFGFIRQTILAGGKASTRGSGSASTRAC